MQHDVMTSPLRHALVVDDEPGVLEEIVDCLTHAGWVVDSASSAQAALAHLADTPNITVMLSDMRLPGMDGLHLMQTTLANRSESHALEVVFFTGHGSADDAVAAARAGAFDFICKPAPLRQLVDALERAHRSTCARRAAAPQAAQSVEQRRAERSALRHELEQRPDIGDFSAGVPSQLVRLMFTDLRAPLAELSLLQEGLNSPTDLPVAEVVRRLEAVQHAVTQLGTLAANFMQVLTTPQSLHDLLTDTPPAP